MLTKPITTGIYDFISTVHYLESLRLGDTVLYNSLYWIVSGWTMDRSGIVLMRMIDCVPEFTTLAFGQSTMISLRKSV